MTLITLLGIAVGLAMDAFAVSVTTGICLGCRVRIHHTVRMAFFFGFFQFFMTVLGWGLGTSVAGLIQTFDHWIAFGLLVVIGGKMISDADSDRSGNEGSADPTRGLTLIALSIATSIDALVVGVSLGVLNTGIWQPSVIIGLVAAAFTVAGIRLGCRIGTAVNRWIEILGGVILMLIGAKILLEHVLG